MTRVRLSDQRAKDDLVKLLSLKPDQIDSIIASLDDSEIILTPDELEGKLAETVEDEGVRAAISKQSVMLNGVRRRLGFDSDEVRKYFDEHVPTADSVDPKVFENLQRLLFHPKIDIAAKATDLSFDFANILHTANVITDIRPVFNSDASDINGCVVSFTLRIQYAGTSGNQNISIAMDELDVSKLAQACTRALTKAETITGKFDADLMGFRTIVTGKKS